MHPSPLVLIRCSAGPTPGHQRQLAVPGDRHRLRGSADARSGGSFQLERRPCGPAPHPLRPDHQDQHPERSAHVPDRRHQTPSLCQLEAADRSQLRCHDAPGDRPLPQPPAGGPVVCADEKTCIQALQRRFPDLPPSRPGQLRRRSVEYVRHGTRCLTAGLIRNSLLESCWGRRNAAACARRRWDRNRWVRVEEEIHWDDGADATGRDHPHVDRGGCLRGRHRCDAAVAGEGEARRHYAAESDRGGPREAATRDRHGGAASLRSRPRANRGDARWGHVSELIG